MMIRRLFILTAAAAVIGTAAIPAAAYAQSAAAKAAVDAAKASGQVGEQADGYLGVVSGGDARVRAAVQEINDGRRRVYEDIAAKTGVTPQAAGEATGKQQIDRLPAGQFYRPLGGAWTRK